METIEERAEKYYQSLARPLADEHGLVTTAYCVGAETERLLKHGVMQVPQFEELLQVRLDELPYTKHLDDGQYNDGQAYGFECGARWAYEKLSSGTAVGREREETQE